MTMKLHSKRVTALAAALLSSAMILSACCVSVAVVAAVWGDEIYRLIRR